jgi:SPFH domain / Band 7 family
MPGVWAALAIVVAIGLSGLKILREYERAVVFQLGRLVGARGPGIIYVIPGIERAIRIDLRTITMDVPTNRPSWKTTARSYSRRILSPLSPSATTMASAAHTPGIAASLSAALGCGAPHPVAGAGKRCQGS